MEIDYCDFPDDALYDLENNVWLRLDGAGKAKVGITSLHAGLAGKLNQIIFKPIGTILSRGQSLATIESVKYFGAVRAPVSGRLAVINAVLEGKPKLANDSPYNEGWFVQMELTQGSEELQLLKNPKDIEEKLRTQIHALRVRCFKAYPDYDMWEIGVECGTVLVRLNELMERCSLGEVVHIVSDDPTADIEMVRWSDESGQALLESRREERLFHFVVKKIK